MALARSPIEVTGLKELNRTLGRVEEKFRKKVIRKGLRAGAKLTRAEIRSTAPKRSGVMAKAFTIRGARARKGAVAVVVQVGKKWFVGDQFYAGFINFGWRVGPRRLGDARKKIPGRHFAEKASEKTAQAAVRAVVETTAVELDKAILEARTGA